MRRLLVVIASLLLLGCGGKPAVEPLVLIAHAGGEIEGYVYTNSREALEKSVSEGYRYIELDLQYTADSVLVAAHSWEDFNTMTGLSHKGDTAPTFADFVSRKIYGKFTPLTAADINAFFEKDTALLLVTDKISSPAVLASNFPNLKKRMVVEAFNYPEYVTLIEQGYNRVLYSCLATDIEEMLVKHLVLHRFFKGRKIEWITMYAGEFNNPLFRLIDHLSTFKMALFTINNLGEIPFEHRAKTRMIYTEKLKP